MVSSLPSNAAVPHHQLSAVAPALLHLIVTSTRLGQSSRGGKVMETVAGGGEVKKVLQQGRHVHLALAEGPAGGPAVQLLFKSARRAIFTAQM